MALADLPDIDFVDTDTELIVQQLINKYQELSGRTLAPSDPMVIAFRTFGYKYALNEALINRVAKGELLRYATGNMLDHLGSFYNVERLPADFAVTTIRFTLSTPLDQNKIISAGTRVGPEDGDGTLYFSTTQNLTIPVGAVTGTVTAESNQSGSLGNGYIPASLNTLIDPISYVSSVTNTDASSGGADVESDDVYRARIQIAPESFSVAGPEGAYEFFAKSTSSSIQDVSIDSPAPCQVVVTVLLQGGEIPGQTLLDQVYAKLDDKTVRPLTDQVTTQAPTQVSYDVNATYYIQRSRMTDTAAIQSSVSDAVSAYLLWQKAKLGRDIDPSELIARIKNAAASRVTVSSPTFVEVSKSQVANEGAVNVVFGGYSDD